MSSAEAAWVDLPFGPDLIRVRVPRANLAGVVRAKVFPNKNPDRLLAAALDSPADGLTLEDYLGSAAGLVIIINDATRPTPTARMLDHILPRLEGRQPEILVATGTHRAPTNKELKTLLGPYFDGLGPLTKVHDCQRAEDMMAVGRTSRGVDLAFHRAAVLAERIVVLGSVEPHYYAGFTGGRKGIMPGVAARRSIEMNHRFALAPEAKPLALAGNPCHEDMEEAVKILRPEDVFGFNVVLDRSGAVCSAAAGGLVSSFAAVASMAEEVFGVRVAEPAEVVVAAAAAPLDNDLYQMQKVIEHGRLALKKGGVLIAVSPCHQGLGPSHYLRHLQAAARPEEVLALADRRYSLGDHKAVKIAEVKLNGDLWAVTGLDPEVLKSAFITPQPDLQTALNRALALKGPRAKVLFLPEASLTVPRVENQTEISKKYNLI